MKNFFKSILNFFKKKPAQTLAQKATSPEAIRQKLFKRQTHLFRKHQLLGKICRIGKHRYRIKEKLGFTGSEKLRYEITQL